MVCKSVWCAHGVLPCSWLFRVPGCASKSRWISVMHEKLVMNSWKHSFQYHMIACTLQSSGWNNANIQFSNTTCPFPAFTLTQYANRENPCIMITDVTNRIKSSLMDHDVAKKSMNDLSHFPPKTWWTLRMTYRRCLLMTRVIFRFHPLPFLRCFLNHVVILMVYIANIGFIFHSKVLLTLTTLKAVYRRAEEPARESNSLQGLQPVRTRLNLFNSVIVHSTSHVISTSGQQCWSSYCNFLLLKSRVTAHGIIQTKSRCKPIQ